MALCLSQVLSFLIPLGWGFYIIWTLWTLIMEDEIQEVSDAELSLSDINYKDNDIQKILLNQYSIANQKIMHYERITWEMGSVLIAGSLAAIGWVATREFVSPISLIAVCTLGLTLTTIWWEWFERHRKIDLTIYNWIWAVEKRLGFGFNSIVTQRDADRDTHHRRWARILLNPKGHDLARVATIALGCAWISLLLFGIWGA